MPRPVVTALTRAVAQSASDRALPRARAAVDTLTAQLATGNRIQRPSDDPAGFAQAASLSQLQDQLGRYGESIDAATLWTDRTQAELGALGDLFTEAKVLGLRAANGVLTTDQMADEVEGLRDEAIARLNAQSGGEYLFAGTQTDTAPIDPSGAVATADFSGERRREVAPGLRVTLNVTTALEVDGVSAPDRLQALADAIRSGEATDMTAALDGVQAGIDHYARIGGQSGAVSRTLLHARDAIETQDIQAGERRAQIEEIDLASVLGALQRRQTGLEAALRASAATVQQSLLNYL
ncbi:hypothetical protein [Rubrivirga sp. IMCC45206]|uniref:flagellin N-terminal helical domain-containing protein n=1 Tax=Rubrivirga sp. IMCC45206 TaxID=3391614 RepID=UPI00398FC495